MEFISIIKKANSIFGVIVKMKEIIPAIIWLGLVWAVEFHTVSKPFGCK